MFVYNVYVLNQLELRWGSDFGLECNGVAPQAVGTQTGLVNVSQHKFWASGNDKLV